MYIPIEGEMGAKYADVCWSVHNSPSVNSQTEAKIISTENLYSLN